MLTLTVEQMKNAERLADESGLSYGQMMENAGGVVFQYLKSRYSAHKKRCVFLVGGGNNGGDGFVAARRLLETGGDPLVLLCCGEPGTELARVNFARYAELGGRMIDASLHMDAAEAALRDAELIVDAIFGTGFHGEVKGGAARLIHTANETNATRISLDIPSGMNADTGTAGEFCVHADATLSFAACKPAHQSVAAKPVCGAVEVLDIGIPADVVFAAANNAVQLDGELVRSLLPPRAPDTHKGDYGSLLVIAGSEGMGGAAMMATLAAMRTGAGKTTLAAPAPVARSLAPGLMEAMTLPLPEEEGALRYPCGEAFGLALSRASACLVGCGLSVSGGTRRLVEELTGQASCRLLLDADGLNCLDGQAERLTDCVQTPVITPHPGEMARLCGMTARQVCENAMSVARLFAREKKAVVVLKGHRTVVAAPGGEVFVNTTGNAGLAKGGSGDVLAGMIAGLLAQGFSQRDAAVCGVYLHGLCADRLAERMSLYSILARDVIGEIPVVLKELGL